MIFYWIKTPAFIKRFFCNQVWDIPNTENKIYLTFDDGPIPEVTEWVLEILKENNIKATFFCIGNNIAKHPEILKKIIEEGHIIGNHTFNHLLGWKTNTNEYLKNVRMCESEIRKLHPNPEGELAKQTANCKLFRPPYGKIKPFQSKELRKLGYKIIMWDVLSADFNQLISPEKCLENATKKVASGSVIVFHDSLKAYKNMQYALPKTIETLKEKGFVFDVIQ